MAVFPKSHEVRTSKVPVPLWHVQKLKDSLGTVCDVGWTWTAEVDNTEGKAEPVLRPNTFL